MSDTTTPYQGQKNDPLTLSGARLGTRVTLTWALGDSEVTSVGILEAVEHHMEWQSDGRGVAVTVALLIGVFSPMTITGWRVAQPHEPNTTPDN